MARYSTESRCTRLHAARSHSPARPGSRLRPSRGNHPIFYNVPARRKFLTTAHELHHDCTGAGCTICAELAGNLSIARGGDTVPVGATSFITLLLISALAVIGTERSSYAPVTLLSLRVRLDD